MICRQPRTTLFPYTTLFRSVVTLRGERRDISGFISSVRASLGVRRYRHDELAGDEIARPAIDRKSTRLNSSHGYISYAVFCLKKKNNMPESPSVDMPHS